MPIVQQGNINTTALVVPDLYVQIVPPQNLVLNGVPTNVIGMVGTAAWGPVGQPVVVGTMADYARIFGPIVGRRFDMGTQVATAVQQGAQSFRCVRATDGTDTAAQVQLAGSPFTFTALCTGTVGNQIGLTLAPGSAANTWRLTVWLPGIAPEVFDNIGGVGASFWAALAAAVNTGMGRQRGPSQLVIASAGGATGAPGAFSTTLGAGTPGSDGAAAVSSTTLVGSDVSPRSGMYALRGQGCGLGVLADSDDSAQWMTQASFGLSEGVYMILTGSAGDTVNAATAIKRAVGLDSYAAKLMFGDWLWWTDQVNGTVRLVSPQGFVAGRLSNSSRGTPFQRRVWQALREIPAGATATYSEIAARVGAPKEAYAVGEACAANAIAVAIPCHRVVRKDGTLAGFRWGFWRKRALLKRESAQ